MLEVRLLMMTMDGSETTTTTTGKKKIPSQFVDPCERAAKASITCLDRNNYDKSRCVKEFKDYRDCKKAFLEQLREDRRRGLVRG